MSALSIAFDITIVGALALPWALLIVHLFYFEGEDKLKTLVDWIENPQQAAAAGVMVFALTYTMGSVVSRLAYDVANDDDLSLVIGHRILRVGANQNRIVAKGYCEADRNQLLRAGPENPALEEKVSQFRLHKTDGGCDHVMRWMSLTKFLELDDALRETTGDIFGLQENALMLKGEDPTLRLRQLHDQIMVLRGAGFDGLIASALCLFGWGLKVRKYWPRSPWRWILATTPGLFAAVGVVALRNHFEDGAGSDPPYMEVCLILLGAAGAWLLWKPRANDAGPTGTPDGIFRGWAPVTLLSAVLTVVVIMGWWSTQVAYTQRVIYSYDSQGITAGK